MTWTKAELATFRRLSTPERIRRYLDDLDYRAEDAAVCPRKVLVERRGKLPGQMLGKSPWLQSVHLQTDAAIGDQVAITIDAELLKDAPAAK